MPMPIQHTLPTERDPFFVEIRRQFVQNLVFFGGLVFSQQLFDVFDVLITVVGYGMLTYMTIVMRGVSFSLAKGHTLPTSPWIERAVHRESPRAYVWLFLLFLLGSSIFGLGYVGVVVLVLLIGLLHDLFFRTLVLYDVFSIAAEFVLKAIAGTLILGVPYTPWLVICTFLLALLLGIGQRRNELDMLDEEQRRAILREYSPKLLDHMMVVAAAGTLISYALYTIDIDTVRNFGTNNLVYTVPWVLYGVMRYTYLVYTQNVSVGVERAMVRDMPMVGCVLTWMLIVVALVY